MRLVPRQHSYSQSSLGYSSLRELKQNKKERATLQILAKLKSLKSSYNTPFSSQQKREPTAEEQQPEQPLSPHAHLKEQYEVRCKRVCEDVCFYLSAFEKIFKDNHRKKTYLSKFYGWDPQFQELFFIKNKEELRPDITPALIMSKLGLGSKSSTNMNSLNKLRLFLTELQTKNEHQQQFQSRMMKLRLNSQLFKLDQQIIDIAGDRSKRGLRGYIDEIGKTHQMMLNIKVRAKNRNENLSKIEHETGRIKINQFYGREEDNIDSVEKYFTRIRLKRID